MTTSPCIWVRLASFGYEGGEADTRLAAITPEETSIIRREDGTDLAETRVSVCPASRLALETVSVGLSGGGASAASTFVDRTERDAAWFAGSSSGLGVRPGWFLIVVASRAAAGWPAEGLEGSTAPSVVASVCASVGGTKLSGPAVIEGGVIVAVGTGTSARICVFAELRG